MWFFLALFAVGFIVTAFMGPKMKVENAKAAGLDEFKFPRAKEGDPVPRFYGTVLLKSPNTISLSGFNSTPIKKKVKTGIFSSKKVTTGYQYRATVDLAWALGPGVVYRRLYFGDNQVWTGCLYGEACFNLATINLPEMYGGSQDGGRGGIGGEIAMYCGAFDQGRDSYLEANLNPKVPAYVGIAHTVFRDFWFGNNPSIDTISMEASYLPCALLCEEPNCTWRMGNGLDANPIEVLYDILKDDWGNLGFSTNQINFENWKLAAETIYGENNGISLAFAAGTEAKEAFKVVLRQINAVVFENQANNGLVEIKLLRNDFVIEDLPVLTPSEIVEIRNYQKKLWSETNNVVRVKYVSRIDRYAEDKIAQEKDAALQRFQGKDNPVELNMPGVKEAGLAQAIAARELSNLNVPLFSAELTLNRTVSGITPGGNFILEWPEYGIEQIVMRVRKIDLGTFESGKIIISAVQDEFAIDATVMSPPIPSEYVPDNYAPVDILTWKLFELPAWLDYNAQLGTREGYTRVAAFVDAPSSYTQGFDAFVDEGTDDVEVLSLAPYSVRGKLANSINRFDGFENALIASITVKEMTDTSQLDPGGSPRLGGGMVLIGDELFAYESFTDNGDATFDLNNVHRAFIDTGWHAHSTDDLVYFFEGQENFFDTDTLNGDDIDVYFIDRTASGRSTKAGATIVNFETVGRVERVIAPDYVTIEGSREPNQIFELDDVLTVDARARNRNDVTELWYENDAASTPQLGTTYKLEYEVAGVPTLIADDVALPYDWNTTGIEGAVVLMVYAKRDGLYSIAASPMPVIIGGDFLSIDDDIVLIDGEGVEF